MSRRIYLVEDDASFRALLAEYLEALGYSVQAFESGEDMLRRLEGGAERPDLVISDLNLGRLTGLQLLDELRRAWPEARVVLMTAFGARGTAEEVVGAGAAGYLDKPFEFDAMEELLERLLESPA